jgi:membrane fusion protein (multidrug efflux system)
MGNDAASEATAKETTVVSSPPAEPSRSAEAEKPHRKTPAWRIVVILLVVVVAMIKGIPLVLEALNTVSTDDAYVNSHVTFTAPRVPGQVMRVLVDDNNRVKKGDLLVELDKEPYRVDVEIKQAAVETAKADLVAAQASVRGLVAQTRSSRFKLQHAIETVDNQIALLRANVAALEKTKATLTLAKAEFERYKKLVETKVASREEFDQRQQNLDVAQAEFNQALQNVIQTRVALGLPSKPQNGQDLAETPPDLDQTFSSVRQAQSDLLQNAAQVSIFPSSYNLGPKEVIDEFYKRDPTGKGNIDSIYATVIKEAPALKQANAKLLAANRDLEQAQLNLRYCDILAEIDGVITRRNVNPGNNVQAGQSLMAIRSLTEIWVDANFKETQLANLRIGQPVDLRLDMYGKRHEFKGRISGFTEGTGSTLALLPAENATGNFIKVVQRLPVRIDLIDYNPDKDPIFVGLSVEPVVHFREEPTGPNAGKFLQLDLEQPKPAPAPSTPEPAKQ